jgi:hypothetical protein
LPVTINAAVSDVAADAGRVAASLIWFGMCRGYRRTVKERRIGKNPITPIPFQPTSVWLRPVRSAPPHSQLDPLPSKWVP